MDFLELRGPEQQRARKQRGGLARVFAEIRRLDPSYRPRRGAEPGGFPRTLEGRNNYINALRADRAAAIYLNRGDAGPLQVEVLRYMQVRVDLAYAEALQLARAGRLDPRLSTREAIGNYVDRQVRLDLRDFFAVRGINSTSDRGVGIQRREYDTSGADASFRIPDVRVTNIAFDATITRKTPGQRQIRGFFDADFAPVGVIIVRPSSLGGSYYITQPTRPPRGS